MLELLHSLSIDFRCAEKPSGLLKKLPLLGAVRLDMGDAWAYQGGFLFHPLPLASAPEIIMQGRHDFLPETRTAIDLGVTGLPLMLKS